MAHGYHKTAHRHTVDTALEAWQTTTTTRATLANTVKELGDKFANTQLAIPFQSHELSLTRVTDLRSNILSLKVNLLLDNDEGCLARWRRKTKG